MNKIDVEYEIAPRIWPRMRRNSEPERRFCERR